MMSDTDSTIDRQSTPDDWQLTAPVNKAFWKLAAPMIIGMLINGIHNLVDSWFVMSFIGSDAMAAVSVMFPVYMVLISVAAVIGSGSAVKLAQLKGEGKLDAIPDVVGKSHGVMWIAMILTSGLFLLGQSSILNLLNVPDAIRPAALDYLTPLLLGSIFAFQLSLWNDMLRAGGDVNWLFIIILIAAIVNAVWDAIFIIGFGWGTSGAALATLVAQGTGCVIAWSVLKNRWSLSIKRPTLGFSKEIGRLGSASMASILGAAIMLSVINRLIADSAGSDPAALSAFGLLSRFNMMFLLPLMAMGMACQTLIAWSFGAQHWQRIRHIFISSSVYMFLWLLVIAVALLLWPETLINVFSDDPDVTKMTAEFSRQMYWFLPLSGVFLAVVSWLQGISRGLLAAVLPLIKIFVVLLPLAVSLNLINGLTGLFWSFTLADGLTGIAALFIYGRLSGDNVMKAQTAASVELSSTSLASQSSKSGEVSHG